MKAQARRAPSARSMLTAVAGMLACIAVFAPASSSAAFGLADRDITFTTDSGVPDMRAGGHPDKMTTTLKFNTVIHPTYGEIPEGAVKDITIELPPGQVADPGAIPTCSSVDFLEMSKNQTFYCPAETAVGTVTAKLGTGGPPFSQTRPVYSLEPPPGAVLRFGFTVVGVPVTFDIGLDDEYPYRGKVVLKNISQVLSFYAAETTIWGTPSSSIHDDERGECAYTGEKDLCPVSSPNRALLTMPRSCTGPLQSRIELASWENPAGRLAYDLVSHDTAVPPQPIGTIGCSKPPFKPSITATPTTKAAQSPTGLDFSLDVEDEGLKNPAGIAAADIRRTVVTLPEGFSVNPSIAEGLNVCSEADLARETVRSAPGAGCPDASKIGTVEVESQLLDENVNGALFIAKPYENPFGTLLAMYVVIKNPKLGILVKQPLKVETDPRTGRITTTAEDMPQLPFSHFRLHFREGARSPLASPPRCGAHEVKAVMTPWSGGPPITTTSAFSIISGPDAGPCPAGGLPPFKPGLVAGTLNNAAGHFSPFNLRLSRSDSEQEFTRFSIKLPPGIVAKLAGVPYCPDAAIAAAKARTGPHGGAEELAAPSCPAASEIGHTLAGAGVGPSLAYAPGKIYLAGPYNGSNLSMVAITAGVVGPFDIGTVVIRQAFKIDPESAEVFIDSTGSDPIPHIIKGIPVHLRDIRAYVNRPSFVLNPTDCTRTSTASTLLGSGLDFGSDIDDRPVTISTPFQAADCAALPFKPRLRLQLKGGTKRGQNPAFTARLNMSGIGEAGIARAQVTLPHSEFLDQAHIRTICTRVQFRAGAGNGSRCPAGSIYGRARATTPILAEPLSGPVILRSSENPLPDLVAALSNSQVDFNLVGRIDSVKGQIRNTFETAPDAPVSTFVLEMRGGKKGLLENSTNLCKGTHRAIADFSGQNGKRHKFNPKLVAKCPQARKGKKTKGKAKPSLRQGRR